MRDWLKKHKMMMLAALALLAASALLHLIHYLIFRDLHHAMIYLLGDVAFIPIEVLVVVVIVERIISHHDKQKMMGKLNMVIGTFFSEVGTKLLGEMTDCVENKKDLAAQINVNNDWTPIQYKHALSFVRSYDFRIDMERLSLEKLKETLTSRRTMLLTLLANPNLLEHDRFTDLLWAIFHLMEELNARESLGNLPETDLKHIAGDIHRVYAQLTREWLHYCKHLQKAYPYIFSIVARTHPLQENPSAIVH